LLEKKVTVREGCITETEKLQAPREGLLIQIPPESPTKTGGALERDFTGGVFSLSKKRGESRKSKNSVFSQLKPSRRPRSSGSRSGEEEWTPDFITKKKGSNRICGSDRDLHLWPALEKKKGLVKKRKIAGGQTGRERGLTDDQYREGGTTTTKRAKKSARKNRRPDPQLSCAWRWSLSLKRKKKGNAVDGGGGNPVKKNAQGSEKVDYVGGQSHLCNKLYRGKERGDTEGWKTITKVSYRRGKNEQLQETMNDGDGIFGFLERGLGTLLVLLLAAPESVKRLKKGFGGRGVPASRKGRNSVDQSKG